MQTKLYTTLILLLSAFVIMLNYCTKITQCALVFTLISLTAISICQLFGKQKAMSASLFAVTISFILMWNYDYYIIAHLMKGLVYASLISVLISIYFALTLFSYFQGKCAFPSNILASLIIAGITDSILMTAFFVNRFSFEKIMSILSKDLSFKIGYCIAIYFAIYAARYFLIAQWKIRISNHIN